jgi:hypothetical protein
VTEFIVDCAHYTVDGIEQDDLGFYVAVCACGWRLPACPDEGIAADGLMQHAYEAGILTAQKEPA